MNGKRYSRVGSSPRSPSKKRARSKAVKKTASRIGRKARVTDRARQKVRRRKK